MHFSCNVSILPSFFFLGFRYIWSEARGNGALWTSVWDQACPYAGRAVCGFHSAVGPSGGRTIQAPGAGKPCQRVAGRIWLWRKTLFWLVRKHVRALAAWFPHCILTSISELHSLLTCASLPLRPWSVQKGLSFVPLQWFDKHLNLYQCF